MVERRSGPHAVGWSYDPDGLPTGRIDPGGVRTGYHHDDAGHLTAIEHPLLGRIDLRHDPDGRLLEMRDGQAATRFGYVEGWLTMHTTDGMSGRQRRSTRLTRNTDGRVTVADTDGRATFYGYDPAGQLCSVTDVAGECRFGYDAAGRLVTEAHPELGARRYSYDAAGQLHAIVGPDGEHHFGYDAAGRRGSEQHPDRSRRYDWDPLGRLTAVTTTDAGSLRTTRLRVDALGQLAAVDDAPLVWDSADPGGALLALGGTSFVGDGHPWAQVGAGGPGRLDPDWQHTPGGRSVDPWGAATDDAR